MGRRASHGISLRITVPEGEKGFVEYRRSFDVRGEIVRQGGKRLPDGLRLSVCLYAEDGTLVRFAGTDRKNRTIDPETPGFLCYPEALDPGKEKLQAFGFPELLEPLRDATVKCWYSDDEFKAVLVSATDAPHGAVWDDGAGWTDGNGRPYDVLPEGIYRLEVTAEDPETGEKLASAAKEIAVGVRKDQMICRFHPDAHRERIERWSEENGFSFIRDPLPGYLDPYLGVWLYHMGLLPMYRANDIALFADPRTSVRMFVYRIEPDSTSYETELAYLQSAGALAEDGRFYAYHYDIGEAELTTAAGRKVRGAIRRFLPGEHVRLCRVDAVTEDAADGTFREDNCLETQTDLSVLTFSAGSPCAVLGVICPWQMDPAEFVRKEDNTYLIKNAPAETEYVFRFDDGEIKKTVKPVGLTRSDREGEKPSVFEFYHRFGFRPEDAGRTGILHIRVLDVRGRPAPGDPAEYPFRIR